MAAILTIAAGALGFISGLIALAFGSSLLAAFLIWIGVGFSATILGVIGMIIPRNLNFRATS